MIADDADRLNEFKRQLSQEDKHFMKSIMNKSRTTAEMRSELKPTLTKQEKIWTANFAWQAFLWGVAKRPLIE
jgi:succinate dehydrogenase flavin-adding protein (antitoxin of CptAB toxin-antitoxin module)